MPDISDQVSEITLRTISVFERPNTTANFTRTKITTNTGFE